MGKGKVKVKVKGKGKCKVNGNGKEGKKREANYDKWHCKDCNSDVIGGSHLWAPHRDACKKAKAKAKAKANAMKNQAASG